MSNPRFLSAASTLSLFVGVVLVLGSGITILQATVAGPGMRLFESPVNEEQSLLLPAHGSAIVERPIGAQATTQLFIGMLLIILGFLFYALMRIREAHAPLKPASDERPVPIRTRRRRPAIFWMEIRI